MAPTNRLGLGSRSDRMSPLSRRDGPRKFPSRAWTSTTDRFVRYREGARELFATSAATDSSLRLARGGRAVREQPRKRLGHRFDEVHVLLASEVVLGGEPERGAERGALGLVPELTVPGLPVDERP